MSWATMVVLIVLIATVGGIIRSRSKHLNQRPRDEGEKAALRREIAELKQRISTLEKIATDKSKRLSAEIDALDEKGKG